MGEKVGEGLPSGVRSRDWMVVLRSGEDECGTTAALSSDGESCWELKMENISQVLPPTIGFMCYPVISQR